jgi:predicted nucleotidyltransferase
MTQFDALLKALTDGNVEFVVIGGVAASIRGSVRHTRDLDVVYRRSPGNIANLVAAVAPCHPYLRGAAPGLPFRWDVPTVTAGLNFTLTTDIGEFDILGEVAGGGSYENLLPHTTEEQAFGVTFCCVSLPKLIQLKRAAGRPRDFDAIAELEVLLEEQQRIADP